MATVRYTLRRSEPAKLDRDALIRGLLQLPIETWAGRWQAARVVMDTARRVEADEPGWLWAYGLYLALAGHELEPSVGPSSSIAEGYTQGAGMVTNGPLEPALGVRPAIGSARHWVN
jgi:hypothetical protein